MLKKIFNLKLFPIYLLFLTACILLPLMYGNCQNSKWHYIIQHYYMPSWMSFSEGLPNPGKGVHRNFSGTWRTWYERGSKFSEITFLNSLQNGLSRGWYENGAKQSESFWSNGMRHGKSIGWFRNGAINFEKNYVKGLKNGSFVFWYENSNKQEEGHYLNNIENGEFKTWYDNGYLESKIVYDKGKVVSIEEWDEGGIPLKSK